MNTISSLFDTWLSNPASQQMMFVILISGAIFIFALGMSYVVMGATNPIKKRLGVPLSDHEDNSDAHRLCPRFVF